MYKPVRNESEETVKRQPVPIILCICYQDEKILQLTMKTNDSVYDLIEEVRHRLARKFENIIGLTSREGYFTLDYALQMPECKLAGIKNNQCLELVFEELVSE